MATIAFQFKDLVEKIYDMPLEDKLELKSLLEHNISEARRNEIVTNHKKAQEEHKSGRLKFSSKVNELKKMLKDAILFQPLLSMR